MAAKNETDGHPDGHIYGTSASEKIGFHGATPIVQMSLTTAPAATAATNSSPYGFSQAQADAIVTWIRAVDAHLKLKGLIASS
jgi:hypothetical protein